MRIIDVPKEDPLTLKGVPVPGGKAEVKVTFKDFLHELFDSSSDELAKGLKNIRRAAKLADKIDAMNGTLELEDADYELLMRCSERGIFPSAAVSRQLLPF